MGGTAGSGSHLPEQSGCRIRQFALTDKRKTADILCFALEYAGFYATGVLSYRVLNDEIR